MLGDFAIVAVCEPLGAQMESVTSPVMVLDGSPDCPDHKSSGRERTVDAKMSELRTKCLFMPGPPFLKTTVEN